MSDGMSPPLSPVYGQMQMPGTQLESDSFSPVAK